mgnify:CR=1 FL=1
MRYAIIDTGKEYKLVPVDQVSNSEILAIIEPETDKMVSDFTVHINTTNVRIRGTKELYESYQEFKDRYEGQERSLNEEHNPFKRS